ncbi:MAG: zinc-dependent metalloprotease [Myxococcales bacterium]|nr:zinc-dependent metalloprotease [Myxococcales bacterium]
MNRVLGLVMAALITLGTAGCYEQLGEIDRTQANALNKADFYGVWYRMGVVTDMPASAGFGFVGQTNFGGTGGKVLFDIQEKSLVVYPYSETVKDGDAKWHRKKIRTYWVKGSEDKFIDLLVGNPVAIYPITGHFDIIRSYSTSTGAQGNELVENTTDNPWYKRKYFRVDWMHNHVMDLMFPQGSMQYSPADYYVQEHAEDDPARFKMEEGYFHFSRRLFGQPMSTGACSTYSLAAGDCSGAAFEVRISYRRADPVSINDFEIRDYHDNPDAEKFGYFLSTRHTFDEEYGLTYTGQDFKAQIWNLWQKSKTWSPVDASGAVVELDKAKSCISNFDCVRPALCNQEGWFKAGHCAVSTSMPYRERGLHPIIYHISAGHPTHNWAELYMVADNWDDVFRDTVSWLYFWEDKWKKDDGISSFTSIGARFGQRFCETSADCSTHALASTEVPAKEEVNALAVATTKGFIVAQDDINERKALAGGALLMFVNASPNTSAATFKAGSATMAGVEFKEGVLNGHDKSAILAKGELGSRLTIEVTSGSEKATLPNTQINTNRIYFVVYYGGDQLAVVESKLSQTGMRVFHAFADKEQGINGATKFTKGPEAEAGLNGVRSKGKVAFGTASEFIYHTGSTWQPVLVKAGSRTDVTCMTINGVGQCTGWKQQLTAADRATRLDVKKKMNYAYVLCTNQYSGGNCSADEKGNPKALNDCRYWTADADGKEYNPCNKFVVKPEQPKILGDSRYNYIYWVTNPHASSPLGYGPSAADPDTGQLFWGTAHIYGAPIISYGQWGRDLVDLLNGDLDPSNLTNGQYIREYLKTINKDANDKTLSGAAFGGQDATPGAHPAEAKTAAQRATMDMRYLARGLDKVGTKQIEMAQIHAMEDPRKLGKKLQDDGSMFNMEEVFQRMDKIKGTKLERAMINDEMALVMSEGKVQPGDQIPPEMIGKISPAGWAWARKEQDERKRMQLLGYNAIFLAEFADPSLIAMAKRLKCKPGQKPTDKFEKDGISDTACYKGDAITIALQNAIFRGVLEHEIGHTVGLRHNFSASADVLNYFDPYYKIREKEEVYCADIVSQFGTVSADNLCEDSLGEKCEMLKCTSDANCPKGLACGTKGICVDTNDIDVGHCVGETEFFQPCTDNAACGNGGVCVDGTCGAKFACSADNDCTSGEGCISGFCTNVKTGKFRTTPAVSTTSGALKKFMPRPAPTQSEIDARRTEFQYSSIMDYGQKINADFHGLGKYDKAAIRYGYGRLLDVFADMSFMRRQLAKYAKNTSQTPESSSWRIDTTGWKYAGAITHPFMYLNNWMTPDYLVKRDAVPSAWVTTEKQLTSKYGRRAYDATLFEVPYKYCSDEYRGGSLACFYFDTGAHTQEIVWHAAQQMQEYYIFDAFKRDRLFYSSYGNPYGYYARVMDRYMLPIGSAARYYAVYNNIFRVYSFFPFYDNHPMYMRALRDSSEMAFKVLTKMLTSPSPGAYTFDKDNNIYKNTSYLPETTAALNIPLGQGRLPWTSFSTDNGYYYFQHPAWIGSYWDKMAALQTMTNSSGGFLSNFIGEQLPLFNGTAIGFNTVYPKELSLVLGGVAAGAMEEIGGYVKTGADGKLNYEARDPFKPVNQNLPRVAPSITNLSIRLQSAWMAIANLPAGFDPSFTDSVAVWVKGSKDEHEFGVCQNFGQCNGGGQNGGSAGQQVIDVVEFKDPFGLKTYVAPRVNYNQDYFSPTYYILTKLNKLKGKWVTAQGEDKAQLEEQMKQELEVVDYMRLLYRVYGAIGL